jgi:hypothetical protein
MCVGDVNCGEVLAARDDPVQLSLRLLRREKSVHEDSVSLAVEALGPRSTNDPSRRSCRIAGVMLQSASSRSGLRLGVGWLGPTGLALGVACCRPVVVRGWPMPSG